MFRRSGSRSLVAHDRSAAVELTLLWPENPDEEIKNVIRTHVPPIVPTGEIAIQFIEETGDEFFYIAMIWRPETPPPIHEISRRVEVSRSAVRSLGGRRHVILVRPENSDPNLHFKPAKDGQIAAIELSLKHGD